MATEAPHISKETFLEILKDESILQEEDLLIFHTLYSLNNQEASATDLAKKLGWKHRNVVINRIVSLGKRILKKHHIEQREREDGSKAYWDFFFSGEYQGNFFIYKLKPELKEAIEESGLVADYNSTSTPKEFLEGTAYQVIQTRHERNIEARDECLKHYGYSCVVCDFNFEKYYGDVGYKFIHVHHLNQIASIGEEYNINPITDLRPVCPNCHAMLHKKNPPLTIEQLKEMISL